MGSGWMVRNRLQIGRRAAWAAIGCGAVLGGCATAHPAPSAVAVSERAGAPAAQPLARVVYPPPSPHTGRYKVGAPYRSHGRWFVPAVQPDYDETGMASWYGHRSAGRTTANGERFDENAVTGAHATLPMPCIVEVTNLQTGRRLDVRLNDRSSGRGGRIVDLSHAAARELGLLATGSARVRVRYVGPASLEGGSRVATAAGEARPPEPDAQSATAFSFGVQAGAFATRRAADRASVRLAAAGQASIRPLDRGGVRLYRVVVGPWPDARQAERARAQAARLGFSDARVIDAS